MTTSPSRWLAGPWPIRVFAVDDCSVQLTWAASPANGLRIEVGDVVAHPQPSSPAELVLDAGGVAAGAEDVGKPAVLGRWSRGYVSGRRILDPGWPGGPGEAVIEGLAPATTYDIVASANGVPAFVAGRVRTLAPPPGRLLYKFATVSDLHIGEKVFGVFYRIHDASERTAKPCEDPYPVRALQAAIDEAAAWGAELLVVKGDLTNTTSPAEVRDVGRLLAASPIPVEAILGNHDNNFGVDARAVLEKHGIAISWQPRAVDVPGLRLVLMSTASGNPRLHRGELAPEMSRKIARLAGDSAGPAWVTLHHPYEKYPFRSVYPPGLPFDQGREFLNALVGAKRESFVTFGHRHRNRRYGYGPLVITEVGSTKDYPGVWAGYKVYEGGLVQVVRRTARHDVISWTEATRRAVNGQWRRWSPGRLDARCFTVDWQNRAY
ncbi:MAG TPA: metallophosphoesterase [Acidimicrobiales bacterium]|nr:metallophosphoesterase [Acidimicrobiales bacterium]